MKKLFALVITIMMTTPVFAKYIDSYQLKTEQDRAKIENASCLKGTANQSIHQKMECLQKIDEKLNKTMPLRGTDEYSKQHYSHLTKKQADATIETLFRQFKQARASLTDTDKGEVTQENIEDEGMWIQNHVFKRFTQWGLTLSNGQPLYPKPDEMS